MIITALDGSYSDMRYGELIIIEVPSINGAVKSWEARSKESMQRAEIEGILQNPTISANSYPQTICSFHAYANGCPESATRARVVR